MRIAVIGNIHGNLPALEAVLADIQRRNIGRTINIDDWRLFPASTSFRDGESIG